ncbi:hypothetical protein ABZN20_10265 [Methylococcus sp. ANG]|uniref:hypothetical protein n=1 Tax=Methylococcus sp. ANG TaxID=3231903 RepID=UPI003459B985
MKRSIKSTTNTDLPAELERVRGDILRTKDDLEDLAHAPLTADMAKRNASAAVAHMAQSFDLPRLARTFANPDRRSHGIDAISRHVDGHPSRNEHAVMALLAAVLPDALEKALHHSIDEQIGDTGISSDNRAQRVEALEQRLFELGCQEERLVCAAESAGLAVFRRADVDPACVLALCTSDEAA